MSDILNLADAICRDINAARSELIELCGQLVATPSINPPGKTADVAAVVRQYLADHDVSTEIIKADDEAPNVVGQVDGRSPVATWFSMRTWTRWRRATSRPGRFRSLR